MEGASTKRANLEGADLTGALMTSMTPEYAARIRWHGVTCPDGTPADLVRGCIGLEGHIPDDELATYEGDFVLERGWGDRCTGSRESRTTVSDHLHFAGSDHIRVAPDHFTSKNATLRFDRRNDRVRIILEGEKCKRRVFLRIE